MIKIGLLSDTHGFLDPKIKKFFSGCDEIWHAGDIGSAEVADTLEKYKPFKAVYGNIDGMEIYKRYPETIRYKCEEVDVLIKHIGGYPGKYDRSIRDIICKNPPKLFISGHSHILKVIPDRKLDLLHINPGAAGKSGLQTVRTVVRFTIDGKDIKDLEILEMKRR
jgi:putative phosphoesterase